MLKIEDVMEYIVEASPEISWEMQKERSMIDAYQPRLDMKELRSLARTTTFLEYSGWEMTVSGAFRGSDLLFCQTEIIIAPRVRSREEYGPGEVIPDIS